MSTAGIVLLVVHTAIMTGMTLAGIYVQRRQSRWRAQRLTPGEGVSVILPIKGLDPGAEEHYRCWLTQETAVPYEVIFSLQDPADPVLPLLDRLLSQHPATPARVLVNPVAPGLNGKSSNLLHGTDAARYDLLVMADSDIVPPTDLLERLVGPLADPTVGEVACLPVIRGASNLWGGMIAIILNFAMTMWAAGELSGRVQAASGACFAIRRQTLERLGGIGQFGGYVAEDAELTRRLRALSLQVVMGPVVTLEQGEGSYAALSGLLTRAVFMAVRWSTPAQGVFMAFGQVGPLVILLAAALAGQSTLALAGLAATAVRMLMLAILQFHSDPKGRFALLWVYPLVEVATLFIYPVATLRRRMVWRGAAIGSKEAEDSCDNPVPGNGSLLDARL